jgi:hypothetical protein
MEFEIRILRVANGITDVEITLQDGRRTTCSFGTTDPEEVRWFVQTTLDYEGWEGLSEGPS